MARFIFVFLMLSSAPVLAQTLEFKGYRCTKDCSGHRAGYDWAARKNIQNPAECGGNSNSFIEGCRAYVQEQEEENNIPTEDAELESEE